MRNKEPIFRKGGIILPRNEYTCDCRAINTETVERVTSALPEERLFSRISEFYKIMGDGVRCKMIFALMQSEMCVCDLANVLSMSKSSVSHQLGKMRKNGVVKCRREGKEVYYSLDDKHVSDIFALTFEHIKEHL